MQGAVVQVVATTSMIADMVKEVGEDTVEVVGLMGPGVDPHLYKPSRSDLSAMQRADVIFYHGIHLEGRMTEVLHGVGKRGRAVYAVAEAIPKKRLMHPAGDPEAADPHVWFDPNLWAQCVDEVVKGLSKVNGGSAARYVERGKEVKAKILGLYDWAQVRLEAALPKEKRVLITSHDAYNYFGRAFGFQVIGVQGISTVTEAGVADVAQIVNYVKAHQVKAIFVESSVSPRTIERISEDSGATVGGELFSDAMGVPGEMEDAHGERYDLGTYEGMFKHNLNAIIDALK